MHESLGMRLGWVEANHLWKLLITKSCLAVFSTHICTAGQEFINLNPMTLYAGNLKLKSQLCLTSDLCIQGTC